MSLVTAVAPAAQDGMPTTRGLDFYLEDRNLGFACAAVMPPELFAQAEPHLIETLYHLLAAGLLIGEGHALLARSGGWRKLLVAALYVRRWLEPRAPGEPAFSAARLAWLDDLVDWTPVPASALLTARGPRRVSSAP